MSEYKDVMIIAEVVEGEMAAITLELLGCGRKLADALEQRLSAVLLGDDVKALAEEAIFSGADIVYVVEDPLLRNYQTDSYLLAMEAVTKQAMPRILLLGQTAIGRDLSPRLAFRLDTAATMDAVALELDSDTERMLATKPVYGGNAHAVYTCASDPQITTVRSKVMIPLEPDASRTGEVIPVNAGLDPSVIRTRLVEKVEAAAEGIRLEDAPAVACGGRGIGGAEGFEQLKALAARLKGSVGATRAVCDSGWLSDTFQIGLTGKVVTPDLYIAVALSGASQHMAGCSSAKTIVAINRDPEANIFKQAHYGVVGDWNQVLPAFTEKLKEFLEE